MEEAFKMRNLLEEFNEDHGVRPPTILGVREHIFTGRLDDHWFGSYDVFDGLYYNLHLTCYQIFCIAVFPLWLGLCLIKKRALSPLVKEFSQDP